MTDRVKEESLALLPPLLLSWYDKNARVLPWREKTEAYGVWVSEIMLQQTRVETVIHYYLRFMEKLPSVFALAEAREEELHKLWEGLGYYSRVRNLQKAAQVICRDYEGIFPHTYEKVLDLPGIGAYTAGAICSIAFNQPKAAVDGNVLRVMTRILENDTDIMSQKFRGEIAEILETIYPKERCGAFTQSLIELGALVCIPNGEPLCSQCPVSSICRAYAHHTQMNFPVKKPKKKRKIQEKTLLMLEWEGRIAICRRPEEGLLSGLWELPNIDGVLTIQEVMDWAALQNIPVSRTEDIIKEEMRKHIFTHIEWHMHCYHIKCDGCFQLVAADSHKPMELRWVTREELESEITLPTAFRKFLKDRSRE